jgi:hypothetical protein
MDYVLTSNSLLGRSFDVKPKFFLNYSEAVTSNMCLIAICLRPGRDTLVEPDPAPQYDSGTTENVDFLTNGGSHRRRSSAPSVSDSLQAWIRETGNFVSRRGRSSLTKRLSTSSSA